MKVKILSLLMFLTLCLGSFGQTRPRLVGGNPAGQLFPSVFLFSELRKNFTDYFMLGYGLQGNGDILPPLLKYSFSKVATPEALSEVVKGTLAEHEGMPNEGLFFGTLGSLVDPSFPNLGSGDSGGPVLKDNPYRIVGVNSNAGCPEDAPSDCEKTTNSFFARIDSKATISVAEWLKSIVHH
ncbi:MAG: hypothetical protein EB120_00540 [Proteobacteria bacterium]|nr:hypothetical protein [Pseudomonadota bacterium]